MIFVNEIKDIYVKLFVFSFFLLAAAGLGAQEQGAILVRGNIWSRGLPGIEPNGFPVLHGEYNLKTGETGADMVFSVWICGEPLVFSQDGWQNRQGIQGYTAFQRREGETLFIAVPLQNNQGAYTAMFRFTGDETEAMFNRLIRAWSSRFLYFLSSIKNASDISLPAVVNF
jgi:hypothetical protein